MPSDQHPTYSPKNVARTQSLSFRFWGLDLTQGLPHVLSADGVQACAGAIESIGEFVSREFPSLTAEWSNQAQTEQVLDAKREYLGVACDLMELRHEGRCVGAFVGAAEDWSTYYIRIFALSRDFQRLSTTRRFARECLFEPLQRHGVQRVNADVSPSNVTMGRCLSELNFYVTGTALSDRWGPLVRYTRFLDSKSEHSFRARSSATAPER